MNKRIKQLADQSGMTQYVSSDNKYLERFVELIIQECANVAEKVREQGVICRGVHLKDHFGVE